MHHGLLQGFQKENAISNKQKGRKINILLIQMGTMKGVSFYVELCNVSNLIAWSRPYYPAVSKKKKSYKRKELSSEFFVILSICASHLLKDRVVSVEWLCCLVNCIWEWEPRTSKF